MLPDADVLLELAPGLADQCLGDVDLAVIELRGNEILMAQQGVTAVDRRVHLHQQHLGDAVESRVRDARPRRAHGNLAVDVAAWRRHLRGDRAVASVTVDFQFGYWRALGAVERGEMRVHPTQKPVKLIADIFELFKEESKTNILDLFGGSGSTLIACEKTKRKCFMMELDPHYIDVIIARWEKFTGLKAELINE